MYKLQDQLGLSDIRESNYTNCGVKKFQRRQP